MSLLRRCFKKLQPDPKYTLYQQGVSKLEKEFDILRYMRKIRVANSVADLTLKKH